MNKIIAATSTLFLVCSIFLACNQSAKQNSLAPVEIKPDTLTRQQIHDHFLAQVEGIKKGFAMPDEVINRDQAEAKMKELKRAWDVFYSDEIYSSDGAKATIQAKEVLRKYQIKMFPKFRAAYVNESNELLWKDDCGAKLRSNSKEVMFWGSEFLPNRNKDALKDRIWDLLADYRFNKLSFTWLKNNSPECSYTINSKNDEERVSPKSF